MMFFRPKFLIIYCSIVGLNLNIVNSYGADNVSDSQYTTLPPIEAKVTKAKDDSSLNSKKPLLENYATYNEFLHAMYLYEKGINEEIKPTLNIKVPANSEHTQIELAPLETGQNVTNWGETLP